MPHSGGGGSSSGGYHGSSSGGGRSSSGPRVSNKHFDGAHRYVYYFRNRPYYYYAEKPVVTEKTELIGLVFMVVLFLVVACVMLFDSIFYPKKIENIGDYENYVYDNANFIDDEAGLLNALNEFQELTGIPITVVTFNNDEWSNSFTDRLYYYYTKTYDDEYHLVIGFSAKEDASDWYFDTMFGNDTGKVFNTAREEQLTKSIYDLLQSNTSFEKALLKELNNANGYVMTTYLDEKMIFISILILIVAIVLLIYNIYTFIRNMHRNDSYEILEGAKEHSCEYCGNIYVATTMKKCPHCGAAVNFYNE